MQKITLKLFLFKKRKQCASQFLQQLKHKKANRWTGKAYTFNNTTGSKDGQIIKVNAKGSETFLNTLIISSKGF